VQISVNVLGRRGPEAACACLEHLRGRLPEGIRVRLLDGDAGTREAVAAAFPAVELVSLAGDPGIAAAHNRGLRRAFAALDDAVLLLSVDARPVAGFLPPLIEVMRMRPRAACVSPKILLAGDPGRLWYAGGALDWWRGLAAWRGAGTRDDGRFDRPEPTAFGTTVAMLVRRQAVDRAGPLDESYANHLHDVDWSLRARSVGMEVHYQPRSRVLYDAPAEAGPESWASWPSGSPLAHAEDSRRALRRSRLRLVASHGRWYHWPTAAPRVAVDATQQALRGWRRAEPGAHSAPGTPGDVG
jgi:GT2 family glycosyltransferase